MEYWSLHINKSLQKRESLVLITVVFVTMQVRVVFDSPDHALTLGRGGYFQVMPAPRLSGATRTHSLDGPLCYNLFLIRIYLEYRWEGCLSGECGRECRKRHPVRGRSVGWGREKGQGSTCFGALSAPQPTLDDCLQQHYISICIITQNEAKGFSIYRTI